MTEQDEEILKFEDEHPKPSALKAKALRNQLGIHEVTYQQRLNRLLPTREALERFFPMLVHRWERQTAAYEAKRAARKF